MIKNVESIRRVCGDKHWQSAVDNVYSDHSAIVDDKLDVIMQRVGLPLEDSTFVIPVHLRIGIWEIVEVDQQASL